MIIQMAVLLALFQIGCTRSFGDEAKGSDKETEKAEKENQANLKEGEEKLTTFNYLGSIWVSQEPEIKLEIETSGEAYATMNYWGEKKKFRLLAQGGNGGVKTYVLEDYIYTWHSPFQILTSDQEIIWYDFNYAGEPNQYGEKSQYKKYEEIVFTRQQ